MDQENKASLMAYIQTRPLDLCIKEEPMEEEQAAESIDNPSGPSEVLPDAPVPVGEVHADSLSIGMEYVLQNWTDPFGRGGWNQNGDGDGNTVEVQTERNLMDKETQTDMPFADFRWDPDTSDRSEFMQGCVFGMKMVRVVEQMAANGTPPRAILEELCKIMEPRGRNTIPALPSSSQTGIAGPSTPNELAQITSEHIRYQQVHQQVQQIQQNQNIYQTFFQVQLDNQKPVQKAPKPVIGNKRRSKVPDKSTSSDSDSEGEESSYSKKTASKTKKAFEKEDEQDDTSDEEFVAPKTKKDRKKIVPKKWKNLKKRQTTKRRRVQTDFYRASQ